MTGDGPYHLAERSAPDSAVAARASSEGRRGDKEGVRVGQRRRFPSQDGDPRSR